MCTLQKLARKCGAKNPAGTKAIMYMIPAEEVLSMPTTLADNGGTAPGDTKIYDSAWDLSLVTGEGYFRAFDIITDSGQVTFNMIGEVGGRSFENGIAFMLAGTDAENREFADCAANGCWIVMIQTRGSDNPIVVGYLDDPAYFKEISGDTGKVAGDKAGVSYIVGDGSGETPMEYLGTLAINETPAP